MIYFFFFQGKDILKEDKENILSSEDYLDFFFRASEIVQTALEENERDIFFDYSGADKEDECVKIPFFLHRNIIQFSKFMDNDYFLCDDFFKASPQSRCQCCFFCIYAMWN